MVVVVVDVFEGVVDVVLGVVVVLEEVGEHDSVTPATAPVTGSLIDDSGVPGGTLTVKFTFWPPTSVTVIRQLSAEAAGRSPIAPRPKTDPAVAIATNSFRLVNTVA